jgi:hypothetical protein
MYSLNSFIYFFLRGIATAGVEGSGSRPGSAVEAGTADMG